MDQAPLRAPLWFLLVGLTGGGCGAIYVEGDEAGECDDGVDNDQDGALDCDDEGCAIATACADDDDIAGDDDDDDDDDDSLPFEPILPAWAAGDVFLVEATVPFPGVRSEGGPPLDLTGDPSAEDWGGLVDRSADPVYWEFEVLQAGWEPSAADPAHALAELGLEPSTLAVLRARLHPTLNIDHPWLEIDPVSYLVVREDRGRPAALITRSTLDGLRSSRSWVTSEVGIDRSYSRIGQGHLAFAPHRLPPWPLQAGDGARVLEDGQVVTTALDGEVVEVTFVDSVSGGPVSQRWTAGGPWASLTTADGAAERLLDDDEAAALLGGPLVSAGPHADDAFWTTELAGAADADEALRFERVEPGESSAELPAGARPWAGSWWAMANGRLVVDDGGETVSSLVASVVEADVAALQNLGDELRDLRRLDQAATPEYEERVATYRALSTVVQAKLVSFFNALRSGLDANQIRVEGEDLVADAGWYDPEPGFVVPLSALSPLDSLALANQLEGQNHGSNPWFAPAWELLNHWTPAGSGWWGHSGWSMASALTPEPRETLTLTVGDGVELPWSTAQQKGLLSEAFGEPAALSWGTRYTSSPDDDIAELGPAGVGHLLRTWLADAGAALVFDVTAGEQVWAFPAHSYSVTIGAVTEESSGRILLNLASEAELAAAPELSGDQARALVVHRRAFGAFQSLQELDEVPGFDADDVATLESVLAAGLSEDRRWLEGSYRVRFSTSGVSENHIDPDADQPQGFWETWPFDLVLTPEGDVLSGSWRNDESHPDFAVLPLSPTVRTGASVNPYVRWDDISGFLGL